VSAEELALYDIPFAGVEDILYKWVKEALDLRHGAGTDPEGRLTVVDLAEGHSAINAMLIRVRVRSDRVDEILSKVTMARGRLKRAQDQAQFEAALAYDTATQQRAATRVVEFTTKAERHADAALDSIEQKRLAHMAERLVSVALEAYEVVNQVHWQLDAIRKDLRATLHSLQFESSLER
jgi:hypothetical protein